LTEVGEANKRGEERQYPVKTKFFYFAGVFAKETEVRNGLQGKKTVERVTSDLGQVNDQHLALLRGGRRGKGKVQTGKKVRGIGIQGQKSGEGNAG